MKWGWLQSWIIYCNTMVHMTVHPVPPIFDINEARWVVWPSLKVPQLFCWARKRGIKRMTYGKWGWQKLKICVKWNGNTFSCIIIFTCYFLIDVVIQLTFPLPLSQCISTHALLPNNLVSYFLMDSHHNWHLSYLVYFFSVFEVKKKNKSTSWADVNYKLVHLFGNETIN